jgi:signal transduction histidine kinase
MRLQTRFALTLGAVLLAATILPVAILYLLSVSGLVEAAYISEAEDPRRAEDFLASSPIAAPAAPTASPLSFTAEDPAQRRFPPAGYDPETGLWDSRIPTFSPRVVLTSPAFRFRVDLPAWLAIGSLPVIGLLIGVFLSILLSRSVTRPVSRLAEAAQAIGRRDLGYRVPAEGGRELKELAGSFNRMAGDLERAERARRNLTADIAHELRTPLSILEGNLRAMLDGVHRPSEEEIALLLEQTRHLNRLTEDLFDLSLAESGRLSLEPRELDLARLMKETAAHFEFAAHERGVALTLAVEEGLPRPALDENRVRQVLDNLLANALRHTPGGGHVSLSARRIPEERCMEISVADTGAGIAPEDLGRIFDRFFRAEESRAGCRGGAGLGLAIVKALVEAQGGTAAVRSKGIGRGSTFTIRFPA